MISKNLKYVVRLIFEYGFNTCSIKNSFNILFSKNPFVKIRMKEYPHPFLLRRNSSDMDVFYEIMLLFGYKYEYDFEPQVIIDCGANIGLASVFFKSKYPNSKIIAIEPEKNNFELLTANLSKYTNVYPSQLGIWGKKAHLKVSNLNSTNWGYVYHEVEKNAAESVEATSITDIMKEHAIDHIDILKIDIEGSEKELFESNVDYWMSRTRVLIIELHDRRRDGCSKAFFNALSNYDFSTEIRGENLFCFIKNQTPIT